MKSPRCWSCGRGPEARASQWTCPACKAHGARRGPMPEYALEARRESTRLQMKRALGPCLCGEAWPDAWTAGVHHGAHRCARVITGGVL
jgi:hypothetical protein